MQSHNKLDVLIEKAKTYIESGMDLMKLKSGAWLSNWVANLLTDLLIGLACLLFLLFLSCAAALYLSHYFESNYAGFLIVAGFYFLLALILLAFKNNGLVNYLRNKIVIALFGTKPLSYTQDENNN